MGKVSPVSTKYIIHASIQIEGSVDRPDVIGAIFGQTEGFLGQELELRELQRSGKVARIEIKLESANGKNTGEIIIPCSLDKAETAIIAAALEIIERIGPCNSKVRVIKIEDVRVSKRQFVIERAKELLSNLQENVLPDSQEIMDEVSHAVRAMEITEWGKDKLPAGPMVESSEEIILVEGRADVLNLLKNGFKNCVAMNGTSVPDSIKDLCRQKEVIVFVDGDRGGDVIIRELLESTEVDFITKAPEGKEVEELTKKEIHIALRAKMASEQFKFEVNGAKKPQQYTGQPYRELKDTRRDQRSEGKVYAPRYPQQQRYSEAVTTTTKYQENTDDKKTKERFKEMLDELVGTRGAYILDKSCTILGKVPTSELEATLKGMKEVYAVVLDGSVTKEVAKAAELANVKFVVASTSKVKPNETKTNIVTAEV